MNYLAYFRLVRKQFVLIISKHLITTIRRWTHGSQKEGNALFNDAVNTFYLQLYGVGYILKDLSDSEKPTSATWATLSD